MNLNYEKVIKSLTIMIFLIFFIISWQVRAADEPQWVPVPEANYADVLEIIALSAQANYEAISSWQGRMNILETNHHYGPNAARMANADTNSLAGNSQHILETITNTAEFAVNPRDDKLCSKKEKPQVQLRAIDLDQNVPIRKNGQYENVRTILTRDQYMWYMPNSNFASKLHNVRPEKMAFIDRPEERKFSLSGDIRDPRIFFESSGEDGKKLWETLLRIRSNINERIKERIGGYPHIEISSSKTNTGIKYRIQTKWRGGENNVIGLILEVDEAVGFNAIKTEITNPAGVITKLKEYTYEKIGEIYLPKTVKKKSWNNKGEPILTSEITIETTSVNKSLPENTCSIKNLDVEEGTLINDNIKKAEFRYSKGNLVPIADPNK
jgi:hypothetical protein